MADPTGHPATAAPESTATEPVVTTVPEKEAAPTVLAAAPVAEPVVTAPADWPEAWRDKMAVNEKGEPDKTALNVLKRYSSPTEFAKAFMNLKLAQSRGEFKNPLPDDASPEQVTQWRKENGIPDAPDKYEIKLSDGMIPGEADKPILNAVLAAAHGQNLKPSQLNAVVDAFYKAQDEDRSQKLAAAKAYTEETVEALRAEWGGEYKSNVNAVNNLLSTLPGDAGTAIMSAMDQEGRPLASHPGFIKWLNSIVREINPHHSVVAAGTSNPGQAITDEIATIQKRMNEDYPGYMKDQAMQARYRELLEVQEKMGARKAS